MILRVHYQMRGGHVHCRVFMTPEPDQTFAKVGDVVFSVEEWDAIRTRLTVVEFVPEDDPMFVMEDRWK